MSSFNNDFEIKKCLVDMLDKVTFGQAEAITTALDKWEELEKLKKEYDFTREYIHDNGLEFDLLSKYNARKEK